MSATPGPWQITSRDDGASGYIVRDADDEFITYLDDSRYHDGRRDTEAEANARLMASAPDLLAALQEIHCWLADGLQLGRKQKATLAEKARIAIAKAEGR